MLQKKLLTEFPLFLAWGRKERREVRRREEKKFKKKLKKKGRTDGRTLVFFILQNIRKI